MANPIQLYVYDLSNGMAKSMSMALTGKQIDGIWHTSVVVFGKEVFYGQGIDITKPGRSHHGHPLQVVDMGATDLDEETFDEYLAEMRDHYTADKYHLLDFNCNGFTADVIGFLNGSSIPPFIKDLPADFLSTPFGAALRPTIDNMYKKPLSGVSTPQQLPPSVAAASPNPDLAASIFEQVAARAQSGPYTQPGQPINAASTLTAPLHVTTNPTSFHSLLESHRAVVAFFTSQTCGPCRTIKPIFEGIAKSKTRDGAAFTEVDLGVGIAQSVAAEYSVRVTPTFIFFLDGKKVHELKGGDVNELKTQVDLLHYDAFPPHPHVSLALPAVQLLSLSPILFQTVPPLEAVTKKLASFIDASPALSSTSATTKQTLTSVVLPYLQPKATPGPKTLDQFAELTEALSASLPPNELFPLVDLWRLAFLNSFTGSWAASTTQHNPVMLLLSKGNGAPRNYTLTLLRMLANVFASPVLVLRLLTHPESREMVTGLLVPTLLHDDATVRTAAASLAFNVAAFMQSARRNGSGEINDGDWEVELMSAVLEALDREKESEEVVHRLTASLAFLLRMSPFYVEQLQPLLEVLQARAVLESKLGGYLKKAEVVRLVKEVAGQLCPAC